MKAAEYPHFEKLRSHSDHAEIELLRQLIWLDAEGVVAFGSYDEDRKVWDQGAYPFLNVNDTFYYASADAEGFKEEDVDTLILLYQNFGHDGVTAWAAHQRGMEPLEELKSPRYLTATRYLNDEIDLTFDDPNEKFHEPLAASDPEGEIRRLQRLIWLASRDHLCFAHKAKWSSDKEGDQGIRCFGDIYAYSIHGPVSDQTVDQLFELYEAFGRSGIDAWESFVNPKEETFLRGLSKGTQGNLMLTEKFEEALSYLKGRPHET